MTALRVIVLALHFIGLAAILGPWLDRLKSKAKEITTAMVWGARAQVVTGVILVGLMYARDIEPDNGKITIKLLVALAIAALAEMGSRRANVAARFYWLIGALTIVNVLVAIAWR